MDKQKQLLLDACQRKFVALCKLKVLQNVFDAQDASQPDYTEELEQLYGDVGKFIEYTDSKVRSIVIPVELFLIDLFPIDRYCCLPFGMRFL